MKAEPTAGHPPGLSCLPSIVLAIFVMFTDLALSVLVLLDLGIPSAKERGLEVCRVLPRLLEVTCFAAFQTFFLEHGVQIHRLPGRH